MFPDSFESVGVIYLCHSLSELDFSNFPKIEVWDSGQVFPVMEDRKAGLECMCVLVLQGQLIVGNLSVVYLHASSLSLCSLTRNESLL